MKILVLSNLYPPDFIGGYELVCAQVVDALRGRGHDVQVLTSAPSVPVPPVPHVHSLLHYTDVWDENWLRQMGPLYRRLAHVRSNFIDAPNVHALLGLVRSFRPDVAYLHNLLGLGGLGLLSSLKHVGLPWVWQIGDAVPNHLCCLESRPVPYLVEAYNRQVRGHYLACSRRVVEEIEACGLRIRDQVELLPNWVHGVPAPPREAYYEGGVLRIVTAGQVNRAKGIDVLIEAAARLREWGHENFTLDIYGRVTDPAFQGEGIGRLGLQDHVRLAGLRTQAELAEIFDRCDVFAFPTHKREPFGCAPLEAAARGCVPVISDDCGVAEWLVHGVHCLKAERTADAFARVVADVLRGAVRLGPLGRRIAAVVRRDFHLDALLPRIERALADGARRPRDGTGTPAEAYHLALLAERTAQALVRESLAA
jgi:glycosyltransferase involved in cell wall biosynthesis